MRRLAEIGCWSAVCLGVWVLTLSSVPTPELIIGVPAAIACGAAAVGARSLVGGRWAVRPRWGIWLLQLVVSAPVETGQILVAAARRTPGRTVAVELPRNESKVVASSRRAIATVLLSASPGSYLAHSDFEGRRIEVHRLGGGAPDAVQIDPGMR
jgi:multisubunit Na+/H+ antiporter MnhE subunit